MASIKYLSHCTDLGWQAAEFENGAIAGTIGEHRALEAFRITEIAVDPGDEVGVAAHALVRTLGWSDATPIGQDVGSTGLGLPIEAVKIGLTGRDRDKYQIWYRVHVEDIGFMGWCTDGAVSGTEGGSKQVEALQIMLARKADNFYPVSDVTESYINLTPPPPPPTPAVASDGAALRAKVISIAQKYIGLGESNNYTKFGAKYGNPYGEWCAYFVAYCYDEAGIPNKVPQDGYCPSCLTWYKNHATAYYHPRGTYIPKAGDQIFFDWSPYNGSPNHTGLVEGCDGKVVCTIEGNTGSPPKVRRKYWNIGSSEILGYGEPSF